MVGYDFAFLILFNEAGALKKQLRFRKAEINVKHKVFLCRVVFKTGILCANKTGLALEDRNVK